MHSNRLNSSEQGFGGKENDLVYKFIFQENVLNNFGHKNSLHQIKKVRNFQHDFYSGFVKDNEVTRKDFIIYFHSKKIFNVRINRF